jgi:NAD(P)-dependent dehydrogenase (short-subunit alcohol dehydrogenase family)
MNPVYDFRHQVALVTGVALTPPAEGDNTMSIVIVGAGPNLGLAIARRFGREGLPAGLVSRDQAKLDGLVEQLEADGIQAAGAAADIRDPDALARAIGALADRLGAVEVLEYSPLPAPEFMKPILDTTADDIRGPLEFSIIGAVAAVQAVLAPMREAGRGTILFTTGSAFLTLNPERAGVGVSFSGEVAYARMLHDVLAREGIHVAHTAINGRIAPGEDFEPDEIADLLWRHHAERGDFQTLLGVG